MKYPPIPSNPVLRAGLFVFGVKIELSVGEVDLVLFESSSNDTKGVAADLEFVSWVAGDDNLIIERRVANCGDSLVGCASDTVVVMKFLDNVLHEFFSLGNGKVER